MLPLNFLPGDTRHGGGPSFWVDPLLHASGYLTVGRCLVSLDNYEAHNKDHFPTRFRSELNPYTIGGYNEYHPERMDLARYAAATGRPIEYVLSWGAQEAMARAEAQNEKRRLRIEFGDAEGLVDGDLPTPVRVLWEPEHLTEPGQFVPYPMATWASSVPSEIVRVLRSRHVGPSAYRTITSMTGGGDDDDGEALQTVTFYPDGWSDSALIELAPSELESPLRAAIRLDGDSGSVTTLILTETEIEDHHDEIVEGTYDPDAEEDL